MQKPDFLLLQFTVLTGIPVAALLFAVGFLVIFLLLLWVWSRFISSISAKIQAKIEARKKAEKEKAASELKPFLEKREKNLNEKILPFYLEEFKHAPIGYWCDPRDSYSRVVNYQDWEFREDGTGDFIFFTSGSGENKYPFRWEKRGDFHLRMTIDDDDGFLPKEIEFKYGFEIRELSISLIREGYSDDEKPEIGTIATLQLNGGPVYEKAKKVFSGF